MKTNNLITLRPALALLVAVTVAQAQSGRQYHQAWFSIAGGGGDISGDGVKLSYTIGQPGAGSSPAGTYVLEGGFMPAFTKTATPAVVTVIDFESIVAGAPGGVGGSPANVATWYAALGVTFDNATGFDYSQAQFPPVQLNFAHSGTKAIEPCYAAEFCGRPLAMDFSASQRRVKVWVGYSSGYPDNPFPGGTVVLRAFDGVGAQVGQATVDLPDSTGPLNVNRPLEVNASEIRRATVAFVGSEISGGPVNNHLTVDDVEFEAAPSGCIAVTTTADSGPGSLRQAILDANARRGLDTICFNIPGPGPHKISPVTNLPAITDPVVMDGYTQAGASPNTLIVGDNAVRKIELSGELFPANASASAHALWSQANQSVIRGLSITHFPLNAWLIYLDGCRSNVVEGVRIQGQPAGITALGQGVALEARGGGNHVIGGTGPASRNIVGGVYWGICLDALSVSNRVFGNYVGLDADGSTVISNYYGICIYISSQNLIGGSLPGARNVVSGNTGSGCYFFHGVSNVIQGNLVGTDATGIQRRSNRVGIELNESSGFNAVGGTEVGARNIVSGNADYGILFGGNANANLIAGNFIGTDVTGLSALGNGFGGIALGGTNNVIGGTTPGACNVISGNGGIGGGISLNFPVCVGTVVQGNLIGTDVTGASALPNRGPGIYLFRGAANSVIGGTSLAAMNVISGNDSHGILIQYDGAGCTYLGSNWVSGNRIGTDITGTRPMGNGRYGVYIQNASSNIIGDSGVVSGNLIAYNAKGVVVDGTCATNNRIAFNAIYSNTDLAIDLANDGVAPNDPSDPDTGSNRRQNAPVLAKAAADSGGLTVDYSVDSAPANSAYPLTVHFYSTPRAGDAQQYIVSDTYAAVQAGQTRHTTLSVANPPALIGRFIVATATDANGNTSELSNLAFAGGPRPPTIPGVAGYFTADSGWQHAIAGDSDGRVHEVYFNPQRGIFQNVLGCFSDIVALTGYYTESSGWQHVIVATADGTLTEVYFNPTRGIFQNVLGHFDRIVDIGGFYTPDDGYQHVIVATANGDVTEVYFDPARGTFQAVIAHFSDIVAVDGFYNFDDHNRIAVVATRDGVVHEVYYHPQRGIIQNVLGTFSGIVDIAGFFTTDDNYRHVIVATSDGNLREIFYKPQTGIFQAALGQFNQVTRIGAYFTASDGNRHVIVGTADGNLHELYYNPQTGQGRDVLTVFQKQSPTLETTSPAAPDSLANGSVSSAGLMIGLAGDAATLYAVSLNAGVWKSVNGGAWQQLPRSSRYAYCIAVDPNNASHLAVGERDGDMQPLALNQSGVWESFDAGNTWSYTFDPFSRSSCNSKAISGIAFSRTSTLFIATPCGIGRKVAGSASFDFSHSPAGIGWVSALSVSESKIWARTPDRLLASSDDGASWNQLAIPSDVGGYHVTFDARGDVFSLAAFDARVYLPFAPNPDTVGNRNTLLIYTVGTGNWSVQVLNSGNGTGLGGRRFVKSFVLNDTSRPLRIGHRLQLFYGSGQAVERAIDEHPDGSIEWNLYALTQGGSFGPTTPDPIHADIWDFHSSVDGRGAWLGCDGGVWGIFPRIEFPTWFAHNEDLPTHHVHTLTVLPRNVGGSRLAYATSDNDAWYYDPVAGWNTLNGLGDANWTLGDAAVPNIALLVRNQETVVMTGFGDNLPNGQPYAYGIVLNHAPEFSGPLFMRFIQTLKTETPEPLLDAVMLTHLPLRYRDTAGNLVNVPGPLGQANSGGAPVLIRTRQFASNPHADTSRFQNWQLVANDLPPATQGFWVSGGHANPVYYAFTVEGGGAQLYKRNSSGGGWQRLNVQGMLVGGWNGPAFVNPYDPNQVYVLTSGGIMVSLNGGASFSRENVLTDLLTGAGKYPLTAAFGGGNDSYVTLASRAITMATLSDMAFSRDDWRVAIASSPFTGAFYKGKDELWHDLARYLPSPFTPVSTVGIDCNGVYVGTEGRSLLRIVDYNNTPSVSPVASIRLLGGTLILSWYAQQGATYTVQYKTSLDPALPWIDLPRDVITAESTASVTDICESNTSRRFYRVVQYE